jgi:hypothetical protein
MQRLLVTLSTCLLFTACPGTDLGTDAGPVDAGLHDAGVSDAGVVDAGVVGTSCDSLSVPAPSGVGSACTPLPPVNGQALGGTITPGHYELTGMRMGPGWKYADGGCPSFDGGLAFSLNLAATANPKVFTFAAAELSDANTGVSSGMMNVSADGLSVSFVQASCGQGSVGLPDVPRVFVADVGSFSVDCCRSSVADAGGALDDPSGYMLSFAQH